MTSTTMPAKEKKPAVSQFRRLLWHVNRTDLGWGVKAALTALNASEQKARRKIAATLPMSSDIQSRTQKLREFGYVDVTDIVSPTLANAVLAHSEEKVRKAEELSARQELGHKSFWVSLLDEDLKDGAFASDHPFTQYALQREVLAILASYMKTLPQLSDVLLTLSRPTDDKLKFSQLWHHDHDDKRVCKLFIYLTDVNSLEDGPFTFMDAKSSARFKNSIKSHLSDEKVFQRIGKDAVKEMIAPKLTSFIVDTARCLHMGSRIKPGHSRLLYTATYFPPPRIYPEPKPRFYESGSIDELTRSVLALEAK